MNMNAKKQEAMIADQLRKLDMEKINIEEKMTTASLLHDNEERPWEKKIGETVIERTKKLGVEALKYRKLAHLGTVDALVQYKFNLYIHQLGAELLQTKIDKKRERELEIEAMMKKQTKAAKLLRRKIKVTDLDDGGVSISIDREWDTSTWSKELIEAGCEALMFIFYDPSGNSSEERKARAISMLQKLLYRHESAVEYLRRNIEAMVGKTATRLIIFGKCAGLLDILYILYSSRESFVKELSLNNFNGKAIAMLIQEARLGAIMIQHSFRAKLSNKKSITIPILAEGWGTETELKATRSALIKVRSAVLRSRWKSMHSYHPSSYAKSLHGIRGPIHIAPHHTILTLEIILHLVSPKALSYAHGNREDVIRAGGCIILGTFVSYPSGQFALITARLLQEISKVAESFDHMLKSGCVHGLVKQLKYLRLNGVGTFHFKEKKGEKFTKLQGYFDCIDAVCHLANHAGGLYRALNGYLYLIPSRNEIEVINYSIYLPLYPYPRDNLMHDTKTYLGSYTLTREISIMICQTQQDEVLIHVLRCLLSIAASYGHANILQEIISNGGVLLIRLVDLIQQTNPIISLLVTSLFLQLSTIKLGRQTLIAHGLPKYLKPSIKNRREYDNISYQCSIFVSVSLIRQCDWRFYEAYSLATAMIEYTLTSSSSDYLRKQIYFDILKTMKNPPLDQADQLSIADLIVLPSDTNHVLAMSQRLHSIDIGMEVMEYICHPEQINYYETLSLDEAAAVCVILHGLSEDPSSGRDIYQPGVINFLSKYLFLCKYLFLDKPMTDVQIIINFNGIMSAAIVLSHLAAAISCPVTSSHLTVTDKKSTIRHKASSMKSSTGESTTIHIDVDDKRPLELAVSQSESLVTVAQTTELVTTLLYFMNTLSVSHPKLDDATKQLQKHVGLSSLKFFNGYSFMLLRMKGLSSVGGFHELHVPASAVVNLIASLKVVHGSSKAIIVIFDQMCDLLYKITSQKEGAHAAIQEWNIFNALRVYLPAPLSSINNIDPSELSPEYKMTLNDLPASFFSLCTNLCHVEDGKAYCLSDGFLRRALDKLTLICHRHGMHSKDNNYITTTETAPSLLFPSSSHIMDPVNLKFYSSSQYSTESVASSSFYSPTTRLCMEGHINVDPGLDGTAVTDISDDPLSSYPIEHYSMMKKTPTTFQRLNPFSKSERKALTSCLQFICKIGNYHHGKHGAAYDLIMWQFFNVIGYCCKFITSRTYGLRNEELYLHSLETIAVLSKDIYRIQSFLEEHDVFTMIHDELMNVEELNQLAAQYALQIILHSTVGITSNYIVQHVKTLREPIAKTARIYPELSTLARDTAWSLTKTVMIYKSSHDPNGVPHVGDPLQINEFDDENDKSSHFLTDRILNNMKSRSPVAGSIHAIRMNSTEIDYKHFLSTSISGEWSPQNGSPMAAAPSFTESQDTQMTSETIEEHEKPVDDMKTTPLDSHGLNNVEHAGTYLYCGVTSCGSLRDPDPSHAHSNHHTMHEDLTEIAKLSARDPELKEVIEQRKVALGFKNRNELESSDTGLKLPKIELSKGSNKDLVKGNRIDDHPSKEVSSSPVVALLPPPTSSRSSCTSTTTSSSSPSQERRSSIGHDSAGMTIDTKDEQIEMLKQVVKRQLIEIHSPSRKISSLSPIAKPVSRLPKPLSSNIKKSYKEEVSMKTIRLDEYPDLVLTRPPPLLNQSIASHLK